MSFDEKAYLKEYYQKNKERMRKKRKEWYQNNKEKVKLHVKVWSQTNKEMINQNRKKYYQKNKEKLNQWYKERYQNNREKLLKYSKDYNQKNKERIRNTDLKLKYGITLDQYNQLLLNQENRCAICGNEFSDIFKSCVDHDHSTGRVRGLLCIRCNAGLGQFRDNPNLLSKAIVYVTNPITYENKNK